MISRFEVWLVQLDPILPCVIISPDEINHADWTLIVAPLSSQIKKLPTRIPVELGGKQGQILLDQIRSIDAKRCVKKLGKIDDHAGLEVLSKLREIFSV
ncbi:MAG: type II toxin-antitoxin system PemK/MazF family toxin [Myxococcaceae bacterium]